MKEYRNEEEIVYEHGVASAGFSDDSGKPQENVNHPSHYNTGKIEVIDFIEDQKLSFHLGNAVKYICRAGRKDPAKVLEDLEKAVWYIRRYEEFLR